MVEILPIQTRIFNPPKDEIVEELTKIVPKLYDGDFLVITSKIVSIHQGRCLRPSATSKGELTAEWADYHIPKASSRYGISLSIIYGAIIASAGIDESNAAGYWIPLPHDPSGFCLELRRIFMERDSLQNLGVIVTDSHCVPMRVGVLSVAIGTAGFEPTIDYRGTPDLFGRPFHMSQTNVADAISAAAGGVMGEGSERTGVAVVRGWPRVRWSNTAKLEDTAIALDEDIFAPLLAPFLRGQSKTRSQT